MSRTLEEAILHAEEAASDYEGMIEDYWLDSEKLAKCANEQRQIAEWLKELAERRKQPERKVGEWVQVPRFEGDTQPYLECPFCKNQVGWWDLARYCNGCGAKLESGAG